MVVGVVVGALSAGLFLLPDRMRRAVGLGLVAIPIVSILNSRSSPAAAWLAERRVVTFVVATVIAYLWQPARAASSSQRVGALPTKQQRIVVTAAYIAAGRCRAVAAPVGTLPGRDPGHSRHLHPDGPGPQHRRRLCRPARPGLRGLLRPWRVYRRRLDLAGDPVAGRSPDLVAGAAVCGAGGHARPA